MMTSMIDGQRTEMLIPCGSVILTADLTIPASARGAVLFAHGSGSSRHSPRNQLVASQLNEAQLATVLVDLLTDEEAAIDNRTSGYRFDTSLLTKRLVHLIDWTSNEESLAKLPLGLFGASTGAAAALDAAAARPHVVKAVVSRGGRVDLAVDITRVRAATLMIVGGEDPFVLELNEHTRKNLKGPKRIEVIEGASHLFEERGALEQVAMLARKWFRDYLV